MYSSMGLCVDFYLQISSPIGGKNLRKVGVAGKILNYL